MGLDELKIEVLRKAQNQAKKMIEEAKEEEKKVIDITKKRLAEQKRISEEDLNKAVEMIEKRTIASAELDVKKKMLETKKQITEGVFKEAEKQISKFTEKKRKEHIHSLIAKAKEQIDIGIVYCNKKDKGLVRGFDVKETEILGGIIAEDKEGAVSIDYSYETLLESAKEKHIQEIANKLFK